ncbi:MAG: TetR/AcrR family transcriptional regulator [bacterium]
MSAEAHEPADIGARDRLFRVAIELFNRRGYAATTVREIVEAAGVTKPVLYYYFGSKEGIYLALLEDAREAFEDRIQGVLSRPESARERILSLARELFQLFRDNIEYVRLILGAYHGPPQGAPEFDFDAFHHTYQNALEHLIREGIENEELRPGNVLAMATALHGATGACVEAALDHPEQHVDVAELDQVLEVIFEGISSKKPTGKEHRR